MISLKTSQLSLPQTEEIASFKTKQYQMNSLLAELEESRKVKNDEICCLRGDILAAQSSQADTQAENQRLLKAVQRLEMEMQLKDDMYVSHWLKTVICFVLKFQKSESN